MKNFILNATLLLFIMPAYCQWEGIQGTYFQSSVKMIYGFPDNSLLYIGGYGNNIDSLSGEGLNGWMFSKIENDEIIDIALFNNPITGFEVFQNDTIIYGFFWGANDMDLLGTANLQNGVLEPFASFNGVVNNMKVINNELYVLGNYSEVNGQQVSSIAKFDGNTWQPVGPMIESSFLNLNDVEMFQGELYVAGNFYTSNEIQDMLVLRNNEWQIVGEGFYGGIAHINRMCIYEDELVVSGMIRKSDGNVGHCIQKWNGEIWSEVGNSLQGTNMSTSTFSQVWDMKVEGDYLYVSGDFQYANYTPIKCLARWDGTQWCGFFTEDVQMPLFRFTFSNGQLILPYNQPLGNEDSKIYAYTLGDEVFPCSPPVTSSNDFDDDLRTFALHPNPSTHTVYLSSPDLTPSSFVHIYNLSGQLVYEQHVLGQSQRLAIATAQIGPPGMYMVQLHTPGKAMAVQKLVVAE